MESDFVEQLNEQLKRASKRWSSITKFSLDLWQELVHF